MIMCLVTLGGRFGRDRTLETFTSIFFWEDMYDNIREFVESCDKYQRANDTKFAKIDAALHPIAVESKVWNLVGCVSTMHLHGCVSFSPRSLKCHFNK